MTVRPLDPAVIGEQCEHTEWVPEIESWVRCTANTLMHTPDTRVLCPEHCSCNEGASVDYPPLPDFLHAESEPVRYSKDEDGPQGEPNMKVSNITKNRHNEPTVTITLTGFDDVYRFAHLMTMGQVEFAEEGHRIIRRLRRRYTADEWAWYMRAFHGVRELRPIDWRNRFGSADHRSRLANRLEEIADDGLTEHVAVEPRGDACTLMAAAAELHGIAAVGMSRAS